jgi:DNA-binding response OmpR family regulator
VFADGDRVGLTRREFELLRILVERRGRVVQRPEIHALIWGGTMRPRDRAVDVLVRKVRIKLEKAAPGWLYIHTHFGIGYRFDPEPAQRSSGGSGRGPGEAGSPTASAMVASL